MEVPSKLLNVNSSATLSGFVDSTASLSFVSCASGAAADAWFLRRQAWSLDSGLHDVRYAVRVLARRPAYTSLVLVTLARS